MTAVALERRAGVPGTVFGALSLALLAAAAGVTIVAGIIEFFIWLPYGNGVAEMAVWAVLAFVPSVLICLLLGLGWALPLLIGSIVLSSVGIHRSRRTRALSVVALCITVLPAALSLLVVVGLFAVGAAPWSLPPAT